MDQEKTIKISQEIMNKGAEILEIFTDYYEKEYGEYMTEYEKTEWGYAFILVGAFLLKNNEQRMKAIDFAIYLISKHAEIGQKKNME
jgi:hypothetical protein